MNVKRLNTKIEYIKSFLEEKMSLKGINKNEFLKDLYYLNKLIHNFYLITRSNMSENSKINKLVQETDPHGNKFLTRSLAKHLIRNYSNNLNTFYDNLYRKMNNNQNGGALKELVSKIPKQVNKSQLNNAKLSEYLNFDLTESDINNIKNKLVNNSNVLRHNIKTISKNIFSGRIDKLIPKPIYDFTAFIVNWTFFPLWSLENLPVVGSFIEIPLDIIGLIIDNFDIMMENMGSAATTVLDIVLDAVQAVPVVGAVASAIALPLNILEQPIEYAVENGTDLIGMFFNIGRKQWGLAYVSAMSAIPYFSDVIDAIVTNLFTANKFLTKINKPLAKISNLADRANNVLTIVSTNVSKYKGMFTTILSNPSILYAPNKIVEEIIIPAKQSFPYLEKLADDEIRKIAKNLHPLIKKITDNPLYYLQNIDKIYEEIVKPNMKLIPFLRDIPEEEIREKIYEMLNFVLGNFNKYSSGYINTFL